MNKDIEKGYTETWYVWKEVSNIDGETRLITPWGNGFISFEVSGDKAYEIFSSERRYTNMYTYSD